MRHLLLLTLTVLAAPVHADPGVEFFEKRIRPLLTENCYKCHAGLKAKGGLRLDGRAAILKGGDSGPAVDVKTPAASLLIQAVEQTGDLKMPPSGSLSATERGDLARWIELGLPFPEAAPKDDARKNNLWALGAVADSQTPVASRADWPKQALDWFILAKLEASGLKPASPADRHVLIRRATLDLTGLPPTPEEVQSFLADQDPNAYERLLDRLLASPAYGERWGRHWLDLVRYCDSFDSRGIGGEGDCADAWRYRDWVVKALNRDLPYDQFVRMQVAGDVLELPEEERLDGIVATGMLAIGNWGGGDADKEKLLTDVVDDQIDVVGRTFLGLTLACARCHDHKFDPFTQKDYYGLAGIFFSSHVLPNVGPKTGGPPMLRIPLQSVAEKQRRQTLERELKASEQKLMESQARHRGSLLEELREKLPDYLLAAHAAASAGAATNLESLARTRGLRLEWLRQCVELSSSNVQPRGVILSRHVPELLGKPGLHGWRNEADTPSFVANAAASEAAFITIRMPPRSVAIHPGPATDAAVVWTSPMAGEVKLAGRLTDFDPNCGDGIAWELRSVAVNGLVSTLASGTMNNGGKDAFGQDGALNALVAPSDRLELVVKRRGNHACDTTGIEWRVEGGGQRWDLVAEWLDNLPSGSSLTGPWSVEDCTDPRGTLPPPLAKALAQWIEGRARAANGQIDDAALLKLAQAASDAVHDARGVPFLPPSGDVDALLDETARKELRLLREAIAANRKELSGSIAFANGAQEGGVPGSPHAGFHDVRIHLRGRYDKLGDLVPRGFPEIVRVADPPVITGGSGRKELAEWLTRPDHPLTARVVVNRVWQHHLGAGIVRTPSNFGALGEPPTHPELLDHLARWFVANGWSFKKLHKTIMLSATYQQSAAADAATRAADPDNRLWGRYSRRRLEAEALRDALLFVAGKLDRTMGGPSIRDFSVARRTLYLTTIRSDRSGFGPLFDVADSTAPVDVRTISTVAPQALFLMNHSFVKEQARAFASRVAARPGSDAERLEFAHQTAFGRSPTEAEIELGLEFLRKHGGDQPAWDAWCHLLVQANEFVVIE